MLKSDAAAFLAGVKQVEGAAASAPTNLHVITGEVGTTSEDGKTTISLDGLVFSEEDSQEIEMDTLGGLEEGDIATIILTGESGHGMTPLAIGGVGSVDRLKARVIDTELLLADKADIDDLEAATARIGDLEADHVSVDTLEAATARIHNLEVDHVSISDFEVEQANIDNLQAATADIATIRANSAKVANLTAAELEADHATIGSLDTNYAQVNLANVDNAWIENGTVKDGAITNAMINSVSANKLTAGTIDASNINVTNLNADNLTTGTINGQRIGEGSLSLSKLEENVYTEAEVNSIVDGLNDRIDGAIETHTGTAVPTLNNAPASSWNTTALRDEHVGDVYYVVNSQSQQNGYCYRFTKSGSTYSWQLIKDSDVTAALSRLTTAEGKITTFDSDISTLKTTTGTLTTKTESLETRMSDAESDILDKVDTTTFNEVSDTVDQHSQTISQHTTAISNKADSSTVTAVTNRVSKNEQDISGINTTIGELQDTVDSKADGSTVSTISNKLNTVSDTVDGHTQTLTSVQNTLSSKADSSTVSTLTTKVNTIEDTVDGHTQTISGQSTILSNNGLTSSTNITNRVSSVEQDLSGYKTTVSETYATQTALATTNGNVTAAQTAADNAQAAADRANGRQVAYSATSSTGASTAAKVAACTNFPTLAAGATVTVRFSAANTSTGAVTLNVNSTGAKTVYVNGAATSSSNQLLWGANANITFTYDGSYWRVDSEPRTWYGTGSVAAATAAKTATINEVVICKGTTVVLNMTNENTSTSATLNVTSTGAKNIYYGTTTTRPTTANGYGWGAGSTVSLTFDGQYWRIGDTTALARLTAAESTISSHTTSISQNASAIALKANSSDVYTKTQTDGLISTEVTNRNAAITAKANEITSSVSETYATKSSVNGKADASDVTALAGRVSTAESNITQNANNIALKVSESDVTGNYIVGKINLSSTTASIAAQRINLQGAVTISDLSSDAQSATLNSNISVGGRNLLTGTGDWSAYAMSSGAGAASGDTFTFAAHDTLDWYSVSLSNPHIPFAVVDGKTLTLSFDYRSDDFSDTTGSHHYIYINAAASSVANGSGRTKYRQISTSTFDGVYVPTTEWQRGTITFELSESLLTSGSGACSYFFIQFYDHTLNSLQLRHVKLEVGNVATDWTPAPEDLEAYADESAYLTAKPNLTPFFEHDLKDVYNVTTNPTGYWNGGGGDYISGSSTFATVMENGWVHINRTNSGTSAMNTYIRPFANGRTLDDGDYTFLVEFRNIESMPNTSYMYTQQGTDVQIWGNGTYGGFTINNADVAAGNQSYQAYYKPVQLLGVSQHGTTGKKLVHINWYIPAGGTVTCDLRLSIYEGNYTGPWKSYVDSELTARMKTAEAGISNAAKTATNYVTDITGGGIMVHPSSVQNTGVQVTSDVDILRSGTSVANYGSTARIGTSAGKHVSIDSDSVDLMDGNASLATFGANDTHLGMSGAGNVYMADDKFVLSAETTEGTWDSTEGSVTTSVPYTQVKSGFKAQNLGTNYHVYSGLNSTLGYNDDGGYTASNTFIDALVEDGSGRELGRSYIELWVDPLYQTAIRLYGDSVELNGKETWYVSPYNEYPLQLGKPVVRSASKSMTITSTNTWVDGPSVYLDQGQWLVVGVACFNSGSSSGNRKLRAQLRLDSSVYVEGTEVRVATNEYGRVQATAIMTVNSADGLDATLVLSSSMNFTSATTSYVTAVQLA